MMFLITDQSADFATYQIGGKAANLYKLKNWGLQVPKWLVIPAYNLHSLIQECGSNRKLWEDKVNHFEIPTSFIN